MNLAKNFKQVQQRIRQSLAHCGRDVSSLRLVVASKGRSAIALRGLYDLGQRAFGENYFGELEGKACELADLDIDWVYIGALQSNKIKRLVSLCSEIQTLSSVKHGRYVARYAKELHKAPFSVYIQVNIGEERSKSGVLAADCLALAAELEAIDGLRLEGVMAIPPALNEDGDELPETYRALAELSRRVGAGKLSLGMSRDLDFAIKAGSTCVRVGRALFV